MFNKKKKPSEIETTESEYLESDALDWESKRVLELEKSTLRAWFVSKIASVGFVLSVVVIALMMPLKEKIPYLITVDKMTGIPEIITTMKNRDIKPEEAWNKHWMVEYVRARETYNWYTLQNDYNKVGLFSSQNIGAEYATLFTGKNALDKVYGNRVEAIVNIISVVPTGKKTGTVRFRKTIKNVKDKSKGSSTTWVATIAFEYKNPSKMKESIRLINPLGFQVLTYRVDPEMIGVTK